MADHDIIASRRGLFAASLITAGILAPASTAATAARASAKPYFPPYRPVLLPVTGTGRKMPVRHVYCNGTESYPGYFNRNAPVSDDGTGRQIAFFLQKPDNAVVPAGTDTPYPPATNDLQASVQLVLAIGKAGRDIPVDKAADHIFGFAAGVSLVRADHVGHPEASIAMAADHSALCGDILPFSPDLHLINSMATLTIDGTVRQNVLLGRLPWRPVELLSHLSTIFGLAPGDLIYCGSVMPPAKVAKGSHIGYAVEKLGSFGNRIV